MKGKIFIFILCLISANVLYAMDSCYADYGLKVKNVLLKDGSKIAYVEKGKGKTLLFIHGLGGNISHWIKNMDELSKSYRCIAIDLPGYGNSINKNINNEDQLGLYANSIIEFAENLRLKKIVLIGHSMGGQIAIITAVQHPAIIKQLILIAPAGLETFTDAERKIFLKFTTPAFFKNQDEATIRKNFANNFYAQPADAENLIEYRVRLKQCEHFDNYCNVLVNGVKGMLAHPVKNDLNKIQQKVLLVFGENDQLIPNRAMHPNITYKDVIEVATKNIKNLQVKVISNAGHMLPFEKPEQLNYTIKNFVK